MAAALAGAPQLTLERINEDIAASKAHLRAAIRLNATVDRLALTCRAMFELMSEASGVTEDPLKKILEIDIRDGQADGRMAPKPNPQGSRRRDEAPQ